MMLADLSPLANHLWQSTMCVAMAWLLTLVLGKNRAAVRYWIWLAASVKFLIPFSLLVSAGSHFAWRASPAIRQPQLAMVMDEISQPFVVSALAPRLVGAAPAPVEFPEILLFGVWLCGFSIGVAAWSRWWWQIRSIRRRATPLDLNLPIQVMSSAGRLEPGVVGIIEPVLLLPEGIADRLTPAQLEAVLAHELSHVRRRDNLTGAIHMAVEAVFWFHPLVWWIGSRLLHEREQACDEAVLGLGKEPQAYAESILEACKYYLESPLACVSGVTGSNLKKRIESIMSNRIANNLDLARKLLLAAVAVVAIAVPLIVGLIHAQPQQEFEAASIKPTKLGFPDQFRIMPGGGVNGRYLSLKQLIQFAYHLQDFQLSGGPGWLDDDRFDIVATAKGNPDQQHTLLMLRSLLEDRFKLAIHHDTKELPVYTLALAKNGPKLKPAPGEARKGDGGFGWGPGRINGQGVTMQQLTEILSLQLHRIVVDKTDLPGTFDLSLLYTPEGYKPREGASPNPNEPRPDPDGPSIFSAIQEQLGLKLEGGKGPVEILVIDHAEKPSEN